MNTPKNTRTGIATWQIKGYAGVKAMDTADTAVALVSFLAHAEGFKAAGDTELATGAQRAWWIDAMLLAAEPVTTDEANWGKLAALMPASDDRPWAIPAPELRILRAVITTAMMLEQERAIAAVPGGPFNAAFLLRMRREILAMERRCSANTIDVAPTLAWQADLYRALIAPTTLVQAIQALTVSADHRATLLARGEAAAAAGAGMHLRYGALKLAGVAALNGSALQRKTRTLASYREVWAGHPLAVAMVTAAVRADATALKLAAATQDQLMQALRGQA